MPKRTKELTNKESVFVQRYLIHLNASKAALEAQYSPKTAGRIAEQLLKKPHIAEAIEKGMRARGKRNEIEQDRVLLEAGRLAFYDVRRLFDGAGAPLPITEIDDDTAAAIVGIEVLGHYEGSGKGRKFVGYVKKYKLADKNSSVRNLMQHLGMLKERIEHTGKDGAPIEVADASPLEVARRLSYLLTAGAAELESRSKTS